MSINVQFTHCSGAPELAHSRWKSRTISEITTQCGGHSGQKGNLNLKRGPQQETTSGPNGETLEAAF